MIKYGFIGGIFLIFSFVFSCQIDDLKPNCDLEDCDYSNQDLKEINLTGAQLTNVKFNGANLEGAHFNNVVFKNVSFNGTKDKKTNLKGAQFNNIALADTVDFVYTDLSKSQIKGSRFINSNFCFTDLTAADLSPLVIGSDPIMTKLYENNIFFKIETTGDTNVESTHLPMGFFLSVNGKYKGNPKFYFG